MNFKLAPLQYTTYKEKTAYAKLLTQQVSSKKLTLAYATQVLAYARPWYDTTNTTHIKGGFLECSCFSSIQISILDATISERTWHLEPQSFKKEWPCAVYMCHSYGCWTKNRGDFTPKLDGESNGKAYEQMDDWGAHPYFWKHPCGLNLAQVQQTRLHPWGMETPPGGIPDSKGRCLKRASASARIAASTPADLASIFFWGRW